VIRRGQISLGFFHATSARESSPRLKHLGGTKTHTNKSVRWLNDVKGWMWMLFNTQTFLTIIPIQASPPTLSTDLSTDLLGFGWSPWFTSLRATRGGSAATAGGRGRR
jgi:hypothetical protein